MPSELFTPDIAKTSNGYKVILSYESFNEATRQSTTKYAEIDVQDGGLDVKSTVELTSFPTLQGHNISDHIYRLPIEISLKGTFADNGLKAAGWIGEDRLTRIQAEFEACQRAGVKFKVITIKNNDISDKSNYRFIARPNMVLTSVSWSQHQHHLDAAFTFKEALSSNVQIIEPKQELSDPNLPAITDLSAASLVGELISSDEVIQMTIEVLKNLDLVNDATFQRCMAFSAGALAIGAFVIAPAIVGSIMLVVAGVASSIPVVGWIVGAACALVAGICAIFGWVQAAQRAEQLEHYRKLGHVFLIDDNMSDTEKDEIVKNFIAFLAKVKAAVDSGLSEISIFRIAKADRQECTLLVNGSYYIQRIEKNNDDLSYRIESLYLGQYSEASLPKIVALESFADCTDSQAFFKDKHSANGAAYRVYIVSRSAYKQEMMNQPTNEDRLAETGYYETDNEKYEAEKENLLDFAFVVAPYALTDLTDRISAIIRTTVG